MVLPVFPAIRGSKNKMRLTCKSVPGPAEDVSVETSPTVHRPVVLRAAFGSYRWRYRATCLVGAVNFHRSEKGIAALREVTVSKESP